MEKFGIFELLDTLSALTAPQKEENEEEHSAPNAQNTAAQPPVLQTQEPSPDVNPRLSAFESLISRHDGISKRIDKKK